MTPSKEWSHHFIHTLEGIPVNWYTDQEMHKETKEWATLQQNFIVTFSFEHENPNIDVALKRIRNIIFIEEPEVESITEAQQRNKKTFKDLLSCYNVQEEAPDEDDLCDIQIEEVEVERDVEGPPLESEVISMPIKIKKVNIGTTEQPKIVSIGDYWDEQTLERIVITKISSANGYRNPTSSNRYEFTHGLKLPKKHFQKVQNYTTSYKIKMRYAYIGCACTCTIKKCRKSAHAHDA
jgi:hypothetical protein